MRPMGRGGGVEREGAWAGWKRGGGHVTGPGGRLELRWAEGASRWAGGWERQGRWAVEGEGQVRG